MNDEYFVRKQGLRVCTKQHHMSRQTSGAVRWYRFRSGAWLRHRSYQVKRRQHLQKFPFVPQNFNKQFISIYKNN